MASYSFMHRGSDYFPIRCMCRTKRLRYPASQRFASSMHAMHAYKSQTEYYMHAVYVCNATYIRTWRRRQIWRPRQPKNCANSFVKMKLQRRLSPNSRVSKGAWFHGLKSRQLSLCQAWPKVRVRQRHHVIMSISLRVLRPWRRPTVHVCTYTWAVYV